MTSRLGWTSFTCVCLVVGALVRFAWIGDVEYKDDEDQLFTYSQAIPTTQLWPAIGTTSGVGEIRHPALGVWSFAILAQVLHLRTPLAVTSTVPALSLIALALLFWFAWRVVPEAERDVWLWTAALASVNFVATAYARKIWIPSLLPIFCVILLIAWWYRHTRLGALVWGIDGALIGQAHMTGFFYAGAFLIGTALFARKSVRWRAWLAGSAWGAIPALPWFYYMWSNRPAVLASASAFPDVQAAFDFFRLAFEVSLSQTAEFNLGANFHEYLAYPVLLGVTTRGVDAARFILHAIGMLALIVAAVTALRNLRRLVAHRQITDTQLGFFNAALTGLLMSAAAVPNLPNHHLMVFPFEYLWIPAVAIACLPKPRIWLAAVWLGSAVCTFGFLQFIHDHCGAPNGDYGVSYRCQEDGTGGASPTRSPKLEALIRPGQEEIIAGMLARGEVLPGSCRLVSGEIDSAARGTYACGESRVTVALVHPSKAPANARRVGYFSIVLIEGSPPDGFLDAIAEHVRRDGPRFEWVLEAGPTSSGGEASGSRPWGGSPPVLTARQILLRMVGGTVVLLLLSPWWAAGTKETRSVGT